MSGIDTFFDDLNNIVSNGFKYTPMTDERYQISCVNDIIEWADKVRGEWDGEDTGQLEDRAMQAEEIIGLCNTLKESISHMEDL